MATTRDLTNVNQLIDWTDEINELDNQYGFIKSQGYFDSRGVSQTAIVFDKNTTTNTLLPQVSRSNREATYGKDRTVETFSLAIPYFKHRDYITPEDVQSWRQAGTADAEETLANVRAEKLTDLRLAADQTDEYMQLQAMKGVTKSPDGATIADMYSEFGISQTDKDFVLGTASTDLDTIFSQIKREMAKNIKSAGTMSGVDMYVSPTFFDKLISHPKFREVWQYYQNSGNQRLRDELAGYMNYGVVDFVEHRGVRIMSYDATFTLPDGSTEEAFTADEGIAIPRGVRGMFRGYYGPSNKLSGANSVGRPMFATEYTDPKDEFHEMEVEFASLYFATKPQAIIKVSTSN